MKCIILSMISIGPLFCQDVPPLDKIKAYEIKWTGVVQNVGFRYNFKKYLDKGPPVVGWIANQPDGSVKSYIEGADKDIKMLNLMGMFGPEEADVQSITITQVKPVGGLSAFRVDD